MTKPRILALANFYLPGYLAGGPVRSIANLVERLEDDFEWMVLTSDRDFGTSDPYPNIDVDAWNQIGKARIFYASPRTLSPWRLLMLIRRTPYDLLYLNSFFDPRFGVLPVLSKKFHLLSPKPVLLAPRGEFSSAALKLKAWKKGPYRRLAKLSGLYGDMAWHASTALEAQGIQSVMGIPSSKVHVARNLPAFSRSAHGPRQAPHDGPLRVCFLSRIVHMKNLDYALRVLAFVRQPVRFNIYGPKEDLNYWRECEQLIVSLPQNIQVVYGGPVPADQVCNVLTRYDLFFLPTRGENFGHVLMEAWSSGVPVLISDQTPWRNLEEEGVGWDLPLSDLQGFARVVEQVSRWGKEKRTSCVECCLAFAQLHIQDDIALRDNLRMFHEALQRNIPVD
jgi:glycosyltransferase involved in cell wall biosynthesis